MADAYQPTLDTFALSEDEAAVVEAALQCADPWDYKPDSNEHAAALKTAKSRILDYHLQRHGWTCCYCRTNLHGAGPFMTDREHVLPKGKPAYKPFSYTMWNLAAACKRCNMQFKKGGDSFVVDATDPTKFESSENYRFVHPNFDRWEDHLTRLAAQVNAMNIVAIIRKPSCHKAAFTYDFFNLHNLEVDTFDQAQGLSVRVEEGDAVAQLHNLASQFGQ